MTDRELKYLIDILKSCERIIDFVGTQTFNDFLKDFKTQSAVERQLGIIGEALNQFRKIDSGLKLKSHNQIIGLRNRLIHAYDGIDPSIIWAIVKNYLPQLKVEVSEILNPK